MPMPYYTGLQSAVDKNIIPFISISNQMMEGDDIFKKLYTIAVFKC